MATKPGCGIIECVPNSRSLTDVITEYGSLYRYFTKEFGEPSSVKFQRVRWCGDGEVEVEEEEEEEVELAVI